MGAVVTSTPRRSRRRPGVAGLLRSWLARLPPPVYVRVRPIALAVYWVLTPHRTFARIAYLRQLDRGAAVARVEEVWAASPEEQQEANGLFWMAHPQVRSRLNAKASGHPQVDAYGRLLQLLGEQGWRLPVARVLSLGCGHGALERGLAGLGVAARYDGIDISPAAIDEARRLAAEAGLGQIEYRVGDLEAAGLPEAAFDIVFAHQSVHHIEDLDGLFAAARRALRPGGVLHLHEYVGPDRFQWTDAQLRHLNAYVHGLPSRYRRLPSGEMRPPRTRPTIGEMLASDPSEAVRSSAILSAVRRHFRVVELRELGGALLHFGLAGIAQNFDPADPEDAGRLEAFFALEDQLMAKGEIGSDFVTVTAIRD
jgi:SAM-dependent methyltransferase